MGYEFLGENIVIPFALVPSVNIDRSLTYVNPHELHWT